MPSNMSPDWMWFFCRKRITRQVDVLIETCQKEKGEMVPRVSKKKGGAKERELDKVWRKRKTIKKRGEMSGRWT